MKVKFIESISLVHGGYSVDSVHEVSDKVAKQWIKNGWCLKAGKNDKAEPEQDGQTVQAPAPVEKSETEPAEQSEEEPKSK